MNEARFRFMRLLRTSSSEIYTVWEGETRVGQCDLHYAQDLIHATLILEVNLSLGSEEELLGEIDRDIISSYQSGLERSNCLVTVFRGEEIRSYADPLRLEEDDDE